MISLITISYYSILQYRIHTDTDNLRSFTNSPELRNDIVIFTFMEEEGRQQRLNFKLLHAITHLNLLSIPLKLSSKWTYSTTTVQYQFNGVVKKCSIIPTAWNCNGHMATETKSKTCPHINTIYELRLRVRLSLSLSLPKTWLYALL